MKRITNDTTLAQSSTYFRFYLHSALNKANAGEHLIELLEPWRVMLANGLTTWSETATNDSRSDSHAWAASPNYEIFRTVLGIDSAAPGFRRVVIRPFLGKLRKASGAIPHPKGEVTVDLKMNENGALDAEVNLPQGVTGEFIWRGKHRGLSAGKNKLHL
jgi:hypothetical protein